MFKFTTIVLLLASFFIIISCGGDNNDDNNDNPGNTESRVLWKYKLKNETNNFKNIPAIDENGNLYFATNEDIDFGKNGKFTVVSIDKNGKFRWEKVIENTRGYEKIAYKDNKVFFIIGTYMTLEEAEGGTLPPATTYALDANNGNEIWKTEVKDWLFTWPAFAVGNDRIYVYINNADLANTISKITAYDINNGDNKGEIIINSETARTGAPLLRAITAVKDNIFAIITKGQGEVNIIQIIDSGNTLTNGWSFEAAGFYSGELKNVPYIYDLPIDDNGNIYFNLYQQKENDNKTAVVSVSKTGEFNWIHEIPTPRISLTESVTINKDGNLYLSVLSKLYLISSTGTSLWDIDGTYYDDYEILNADYQKPPTIAENENTYHHNSYGLVSVKSDGKINWKHLNENDNIQGADYSTLMPDGSIIVMGTKEIICFKGDDTKLATTNWPKIYGNNGNTSSK